MSIKELWERLKGYARNARRQVFLGSSRDNAYWGFSIFRLEVRRWRSPVRWDIILWWPRIIVIKGKVERPK